MIAADILKHDQIACPCADRFLAAQAHSYEAARAELGQGRKQSHWMWFIFPQMRGLGHSKTSHFYGIADRDEAVGYSAHPVLGQRLIACADAVLAHPDLTARAIFGAVDAAKLRSSATLFAIAAPEADAFHRLIERFFDGVPCRLTLTRLGTPWPGQGRDGASPK